MPPVIAAVAAIGSAITSALGVATLAAAAGSMLSVGIGALAIGTAVVVGQSLLSGGKPKVTNSKENLERLRASIDPRTPRKTVVGKTALATDIRDEEFTDSQEYFHRFIVVAAHKVHAIREVWFDDKKAWDSVSGVTSEFSGYLWVTPILEGSSANAINISARMGTTRRYTGLAYLHLKYKLTGNSKKTDSPFAQSITTRITIRGDGAYLYDPRLDSTVAGGSGSQRADDQTTWAWSDSACRNPALALLFYLLGWTINGELSVGKGIPPNRIDLESFAVAANICDETVSTVSGTEPRYRCDGVWSEGDQPTTVIDMLKACMNADLDDVDGKLRLTVFHNDLADIAADFDENDVLGGFEWNPSPSLAESFNVVRGVYTDASDTSLYQPVDYPEVSIASPDGIERILPFDVPMVESATQAQRLAQGRLARQQFGGTFKAEFQATAWAVQKNSVVRLTFAPLGFVNKLFRVAEMTIRVDGVVPLVLREESAAIYDAPVLADPIAPIASTPYDPALNPIYQALSTGEQTLIASSYTTDADPADGLLQATDMQIVVETHTRTYTDKAVSVTGATLTTEADGTTALAADTWYHVYYDDGARAGGAIALKATQTQADSVNSATHTARHYVGSIKTDVVGGTGTSAGGAIPPGYNGDTWWL